MSSYAFLVLGLLLGVCNASDSVKSEQANDQWFKDGLTDLNKHLHFVTRKPNHNPAKNAIIFIGDGCDITTNTAARILKGQLKGNSGEEESLAYEKFPYTGLSKTYNTNRQVSDSASTANAILTGVKTRSALIGVNKDVVYNKCSSLTKERKMDSILKFAEDAGMSTGFVTTMRVTHATPANLYAHLPSRYWENDKIKLDKASDAASCNDTALQLVEFQGHKDGIEVVFGGGRMNFLPNTIADPEHVHKTGERLDGRNLIGEWLAKQQGSKYVWNKAQMDAIDLETTKHVLGLFEYSYMNYAMYRANDTAGEPSLAEMVEKAITILKKNPKGFFLMVEGGLIDYGHHGNSAYKALTETLAMDKAVTKATELTSEDDTLLIVTADHAHTMTISGYPDRGNPIFGLVKQDRQVRLASNDKMPFTTLGYQNGPSAVFGRRKNLTGVNTRDGEYQQQSLYNTVDKYESHGGQDVGIYSRGPWTDLLVGVVEQNYIFHVMDHALCLTNSKQGKCRKPVARGGSGAGCALASLFTVLGPLFSGFML